MICSICGHKAEPDGQLQCQCNNLGRAFSIFEPPIFGPPLKDVHTEHCCIIHGCKYGKDDICTVVQERARQSYACETCNEMLGLNTVEDVFNEIERRKSAALEPLFTDKALLEELDALAANAWDKERPGVLSGIRYDPSLGRTFEAIKHDVLILQAKANRPAPMEYRDE